MHGLNSCATATSFSSHTCLCLYIIFISFLLIIIIIRIGSALVWFYAFVIYILAVTLVGFHIPRGGYGLDRLVRCYGVIFYPLLTYNVAIARRDFFLPFRLVQCAFISLLNLRSGVSSFFLSFSYLTTSSRLFSNVVGRCL
uniref:Uncharacterized protein n=1 Tax=Trypanosoma congolense (strain IL3000) TaxID=1068625 RepID=G0UZ24_TRYCI|nr:hypothetical protein, unlikely [Trypanosoma congolense IL3000]